MSRWGLTTWDPTPTAGFWVSAALATEHSRESWGFSSWAEATEFPGIWRGNREALGFPAPSWEVPSTTAWSLPGRLEPHPAQPRPSGLAEVEMPGREMHGDAGKPSRSHCPATGLSQEPTSTGTLPPPPPASADFEVLTSLLAAPPTATTLASMATLGLDPSRDVPDSRAAEVCKADPGPVPVSQLHFCPICPKAWESLGSPVTLIFS